MKCKLTQKGFTLLESIAAIVLAGIVAVAVAPDLSNSHKALNIDGAAKQIEADIRYAQNMANTTGDTYGFVATSNTTYMVYHKNGGVLTPVTSPYNREEMNIDMETHYEGVTFVPEVYPAYTVEFDASGKPTSGGGTVVSLSAGDDLSKTVTITSETGNIQMQ